MRHSVHGPIVGLLALGACAPMLAHGQAIRSVPSQYSTIQAAIDAAAYNDSIRVSPGTYFERIDFKGKAVMLVSTDGPAATVIDGSGQGTVVTFNHGETAMSVLEGFTIRNGSASFGAGINMLVASPTIVGNIFESNAQGGGGFGAAISGNNASPIVERNVFRNNGCDTQFLSGVVSFVNGSSPWVFNNVFVDNDCTAINMTLPTGNTPRVFNNTIVGNRTGVHVDGRVPTGQQVFQNNLIAGNDVGLEIVFYSAGNEPTWTHNLIWGNLQDYSGIASRTGMDGNISADPKLAGAGSGDVHLTGGSAAIDAGLSMPIGFPEQDVDGDTRILDGDADGSAVVDIGADEFTGEYVRAFAAFNASLRIQRGKGRKADQLGGDATFRVSSAGDGIRPATEALTLRLSDADGVIFEQTLPAGALSASNSKRWVYRAPAGSSGIDSVVLRPVSVAGDYAIEFAASRVDLSGADRATLAVALTIGDDEGEMTLSCNAAQGGIACH